MFKKPFLFLFSLISVANFIGAAEVEFTNTSNEKKTMIQQVIEKENKTFFSPRSIHLDLLKNCPHAISTLAQWVYEEWRLYDTSLTKEKMIRAFTTRLNDDKIPLTFVALKNDILIGTISLKKETASEFSDFPENSVWIGSFHILPAERNQGLGHELLQLAQTIARQFGHENLYFYTSNSANVNWYLKRGACIIEERPFRNHRITIMKIPLKDPPTHSS